jgi:hypothetical protein
MAGSVQCGATATCCQTPGVSACFSAGVLLTMQQAGLLLQPELGQRPAWPSCQLPVEEVAVGVPQPDVHFRMLQMDILCNVHTA